MKNLVIAALLCTGLVQLGTGCVIVGDDGEDPPPPPPPPPPPGDSGFSVAWILLGDLTPDDTEDPLVEIECESPTDLIQVVSDPDPNFDGDEIVDRYDCIDGVGETAALDPGVYDVWVELRTQDGSQLLAQSDVEPAVALGEEEVVELDFTFPVDYGTFSLRWDVQDNGAPSDCEAVDSAGVSVVSTLVGEEQTFFDDIFDCDSFAGESNPIPLGRYTLSTALLDANEDPLLTAEAEEISLDFGNQNVDIGTIVFDLSE
jgi:hypothetical protein